MHAKHALKEVYYNFSWYWGWAVQFMCGYKAEDTAEIKFMDVIKEEPNWDDYSPDSEFTGIIKTAFNEDGNYPTNFPYGTIDGNLVFGD